MGLNQGLRAQFLFWTLVFVKGFN